MSGTDEFGTGGYGTGDAERAAAEPGAGGSVHDAPPTGPRVHVPGEPNQGAGGAPWLAAGAGSVPYAEAVFGGAGQEGQQAPGGPVPGARGAERAAGRAPRGAGRRGVPEPAPQQVQRVQAGGSGSGYAEGYGPDYGPDGYANGYVPHPAQQQPRQQQPQAPQLPQQRYDAAPFDSGFTQQARFAAAQAAAAAAGGQGPGGYEQPTAQQPGAPGAGYAQGQGQQGQGLGQDPYQSGAYPGAGAGAGQAPHPGFDEPTTEFLPGPLFDEPTVRPASPPPTAGPGGVNGRGPMFNARQGSAGPANGTGPGQTAPGQPAGTTQRPSMSGSGTWTAAPPPGAQPPFQPQAPVPPQPQQAQQQQPPQAAGPAGPAGGQQPAPGPSAVSQLSASQSSASVSGIPRVPSHQAAGAVAAQSGQSAPSAQSPQSAQSPVPPAPPAGPSATASGPLASASAAPVGSARGEAPRRADGGYSSSPLPSRPPLPDEPPPGPPPLPTRPPRAERLAAQQAQAQAQAQAAAAPVQPAAPLQQNPPQAAVQSPATAAVRETLTPPRRTPQPPLAQPRQQAQQSADDLTSARLRSVAPNVPTPRTVAPETRPAGAAPPAVQPRTPAPAAAAPPAPGQQPGRSGAFDALAEPPAPHASGADEGDELIVPWQAADAAPQPQIAQTPEDDDVLHGSGAHQQQLAVQQPQQPPSAEHAPTSMQSSPMQSSPTQSPQAQSPQTTAPTRAEATGVQPTPLAANPPAPAAPQPQPQNTAYPAAVPQPQTPGPIQPQAPAAAQPAAAPQPAAQSPIQPSAVPTGAQSPIQPIAAPQPQTPTAAPVGGPTGPAGEPDPSDLPAPRGTRRRVTEPDPGSAADADPRSYAPTAAAAPDAFADPADPGDEGANFPTAPQPRLPLTKPNPNAAANATAAASASGARMPAYEDDALAAVYRVIHERRDVRNDFLPDPVPTEVLTRILQAAHTAPSVGFSQPWDFLVIRDQAMRQRVHELAVRQRRAYAASLPKARARAFAALKIEAILDTPVNIVVTCDPTRGGRHTLGRYTQPLMAPFSSCLAVENLWLAARAEGLGVGWVSFFDERELTAVLDLPDHLQVVAYLCVGYVTSFPPEPELAGAGWAQRRPLAWAVHEERFGHRALPGAAPISLLSETVAAIRGLDPEALGAARDRQARMTKPPGSLGALEAVSEQLSGLAGVCPPPQPEPAALAVFAADHGVHAQGVTPWPQEVTAQMVANFLAGGAVVNAFAKQVGAEVCVVDVGVAADLAASVGLIPRKIRYGTADMTQGPALTREEATAAIEAGIETARDLVAAGNRCLLTGDMGIANTTASAALIAAFTGASPAQVTGYGTGIDEQTYAHKVEVVRTALELHRPDPADPVGVLCAFGGLEHAALAGFVLGAAALRVPVVLDGVIAGAAALVAQALSPEVTAACVAGHRSAEPGHALALEQLGITPLIDLELRLGEGSGAALALPLVGAAVRALREVATFDDAGVSDASSASVAPPTERERT